MDTVTKTTEVCMCECHREGRYIMHCVPCCNLTYKQYLTKEGELIPVKFGVALREKYEGGKNE